MLERNKNPLRFFNAVVALFNFLIIVLSISSSYSDHISPDRMLFSAYLGLLFPFFILLNFFFLLYWFIMRKWFFLLMTLVSLLICWPSIRQYVPIHPKTKELPKGRMIKLLTYNAMAFDYQDHTKEKPNKILQYIADTDADIVCLQEHLVGTSKNVLSQKKVEEVLSRYPYYKTFPLVYNQKYSIGLALYSKYAITNAWKVRYNSGFNGSAVFELNINGKKMVVVNNHLESFKLTTEDRQKYIRFIKNINSETFDGLRETIQRKLGPAFLHRAEQAEIVLEEIKRLNADYLIVCGDFNDTPISYAYRTIRGDLKDAFVESGSGLGVTYNQNFFWLRIDHILHSDNMKAYNATVGKVAYSDHYPVWCYLELN